MIEVKIVKTIQIGVLINYKVKLPIKIHPLNEPGLVHSADE